MRIKQDVEWLGFQWAGKGRYASDYFDQFMPWAIFELIKSAKGLRTGGSDPRGGSGVPWQSLTEPGAHSPFRGPWGG